MEYKIKKNDKLLKPRRNKNYPWADMKVLDSFDVESPEAGMVAMMAFYQARKRGLFPEGTKFQRIGSTIQRIS